MLNQNLQQLRSILIAKQFQIYALSEYGNLLFAYSPSLAVLSEQTLRILPISITFTQLQKFTFQRLSLSDLTVTTKQGSVVHNKKVVWGFFTNRSDEQVHADSSIFFLSLFLRFLSSKPNTLQGILNTEKDKTDRQGYEFGLKDLTVESLNTYNECFPGYKETIDNNIVELLDEYELTLGSFRGFVMNLKGDMVYGSLGDMQKFKEIITSRGKAMKNSYKHENMKVELNLIGKKKVLMAGLCPVLSGLIVGLIKDYTLDPGTYFKFIHNVSIFWSSDHGHLAQSPESLFLNLKNSIESLEKLLQLLVPRSVKGPKFCKKVSPGQSRIYLSQELNLEPYQMNESSFNVSTIQQIEYFEMDQPKDYSANVSVVENNLEEDFSISQERITPGLVNLDDIVEEVLERRSKTPSQMEGAPSPDMNLMTKNGRWYRKSSEQFSLNSVKPKFKILPPVKSAKHLKYVQKSNSSRDLREENLLEFEDNKKLGINNVYENMEKYVLKNHRPARDDWID